MLEFGRWDAKRGWTKQLHLGALRNNNSRLLKKLGPDTGFDSIGDFPQARALSRVPRHARPRPTSCRASCSTT
jgi:glucuronate isomerase